MIPFSLVLVPTHLRFLVFFFRDFNIEFPLRLPSFSSDPRLVCYAARPALICYFCIEDKLFAFSSLVCLCLDEYA